jgi:opacity protein-like surface antigen
MRLWLAGVLLAAAVPAAAQTVEIVPFGGYRFGGSFDVVEGGRIAEVKESASFGASLTVSVAEDGEIEALFARQDTRLASDALFTSTPLFDLAVETWQIGGNYLLRDAEDNVRPYIGAALGVTRLVPEPSDLESETRFSASFAGGVKVQLARHVGLRLEVRGFFTVLESDSRVFCDSFSGCLVQTSGSELSQGEVRGGLVFRF